MRPPSYVRLVEAITSVDASGRGTESRLAKVSAADAARWETGESEEESTVSTDWCSASFFDCLDLFLYIYCFGTRDQGLRGRDIFTLFLVALGRCVLVQVWSILAWC